MFPVSFLINRGMLATAVLVSENRFRNGFGRAFLKRRSGAKGVETVRLTRMKRKVNVVFITDRMMEQTVTDNDQCGHRHYGQKCLVKRAVDLNIFAKHFRVWI